MAQSDDGSSLTGARLNYRQRLPQFGALQRPRALVLVVVATVATGVGTALLDAKLAVGIVGALVMFILVLQFELMFTLSASDEDAQVTLRELAPVVTVHEHFPAESAFLLRLAADQARYAESTFRQTAFDAELDEERQSLLRRYDECVQGAMRIDLRPSSISRETDAASMMTSELLATSLVDPVDYWDVPVRLKYLREQEAKLKLGARLRRVFIEREGALAPLRKVVAQHLEWQDDDDKDAECRIAIIGRVPDRLVEDFAIVNRDTVIRLETLHDMPSFAVWETSPDVVKARIKNFELLWDEAVDPLTFTEFQT